MRQHQYVHLFSSHTTVRHALSAILVVHHCESLLKFQGLGADDDVAQVTPSLDPPVGEKNAAASLSMAELERKSFVKL